MTFQPLYLLGIPPTSKGLADGAKKRKIKYLAVIEPRPSNKYSNRKSYRKSCTVVVIADR